MEQKKVTIEALLEKGKVNGKLSEKEITDVMEDLDFDLDQFLSRCEQLNIEIINDNSEGPSFHDTDENLNVDDLESSLSTDYIHTGFPFLPTHLYSISCSVDRPVIISCRFCSSIG